jgi:hypothetical protein
MKKVKLLMMAWLLVCFSAFAQQTEVEKTYDITGKSKRGTLANAEYNPTDKTYTLTYITKSTDRKVKVQVYHFDHDFNFINMNDDEMEVEKVKTKFTWFKYRGDAYSIDGISVDPNLLGNLVLRKKRISYEYDWLSLQYEKKVEVLEKLKPKSDEGTKYYYLSHAEDDKTGDVIILCGIRDPKGKGSDPVRQWKDLVVLRYNHDLDLVSQTKLPFEFPQALAMVRTYDESNPQDIDNPGLGGICFIFAPTNASKLSDPVKNNYTYVRYDATTNKIVERIPFNSPASYWKIDQMVMDQSSDEWYVFGPSAAGKDKYFSELTATTKFKAVQLMKIHNGKMSYLTETTLDEFEKKLKTPPSQKKSPAYDGKQFVVA